MATVFLGLKRRDLIRRQIVEKSAPISEKDILLKKKTSSEKIHYKNAQAHISIVATKLIELCYELSHHSTYALDLSPLQSTIL